MSQECLSVGFHLSVESFLQFLCSYFSNFCVFHNLGFFFVITSYYKFRNNRELLGCKAKSLLCYFIGNALYFKQDTTRRYGKHKTYRVTLTFTHTYIRRLLGDRFVREDSDPNLSLTLHIASHCYTGSLNLTTIDPFGLKALDAETAKSQLVAPLGITLATTLLRSSVFSSFRL